MKIAILMSYTYEIYDWCKYSIEINRIYAQKHRYDFIVESVPPNPLHHGSWNKLLMIKRNLPQYDWCFWIDADACFLDHSICLESFMEGSDFHACTDFHWFKDPSDYMQTLNTGTMLIKNTRISHIIIDNALQYLQEWAWKPQWDQTALNRIYNNDKTLMKIHPQFDFNGAPPWWPEGKQNTFVAHLMGRTYDERMTFFSTQVQNFKSELCKQVKEKANCVYRKNHFLRGKKVAIVTRCMDRLVHLKASLPSWLVIPQIDSITITDWSSKEDILSFINEIQDNRITVLRVPNKTSFERSKAHNVGIRYTMADVICLFDVDVVVTDPTILNIVNSPNEFYTNRQDYEWFECNGSCIFWRKQWEKINGFYEGFIDYGEEDHDFYNRLQNAGFIEKKMITRTMFQHIYHDDFLRNQHHNEKDKYVSCAVNENISKIKKLRDNEFMEKQFCVVYHNGNENKIEV